ncbi:MAG: hypothetical protein H0X37_05060 [Herpetosiphonaceae bacterium]|nr:hypothetical protein [Herpetosiphonaceae bacterium]
MEAERRFFIGAIAHDLRTPLFALRGYLVGLEQGLATSPAQAAHYVAVCREKADQLERLVADLFAFTKLEYLEPTLCRAPLDLGLLLHRALDGLQDQAATKGVTLTLNAPSTSCMPVGDEHLLRRVVENLLDNALRHTPRSGAILVDWHCEPNRVVFSVTDSGPGIAPADMPYLFDPLYRGEV